MIKLLHLVKELNKKYPGKKILKNGNPVSEIVCEVEKGNGYSIAIAVIEKSVPHLHKKTTEEYEVMKESIKLFINNKRSVLKKGEKIVIKPNQVHFAEGNETWVKVTSHPGWLVEDHILIK